jgi:hypothetical protein
LPTPPTNTGIHTSRGRPGSLPGVGFGIMGGVIVSVSAAVANAHAWFETNSGWAAPDADTIAEWTADGVCRCPDECLVAPEGWCEHGLASWWLILNEEAIEPGAVRPARGGPARRALP